MSLRRKRLSPDFLAVPAEQPVPGEVRIADIDDRLTALAVIPRADRSETWDEQVDRLLAMRNAIRPAKEPRPVPVVPGRVDSIHRQLLGEPVNDLPYGIGCPACPAWLVVSDEDPDTSVSELHDHIYWTHAPNDAVRTNLLLAQAVELTEAEAAKR